VAKFCHGRSERPSRSDRRCCDGDAAEIGDEYVPQVAALSRLDVTIMVKR
jgi:hypothetical protein